jgi:hypothetical protein
MVVLEPIAGGHDHDVEAGTAGDRPVTCLCRRPLGREGPDQKLFGQRTHAFDPHGGQD